MKQEAQPLVAVVGQAHTLGRDDRGMLGSPLCFPLKYSERGGLSTRIKLGNEEVKFRKEPAFGKSDEVLHRALKVGPQPEDLLGLAINLTRHTVYFDLNQGSEMMNDPKGFYRATASGSISRNIRFCVSKGGINRWYLMDLIGPEQAYAISVYAGMIELHGRKWQIEVQDNLDGKFDSRDQLLIIPINAAGRACIGYNAMPILNTLFLGGHQYEIRFAYHAGAPPVNVTFKEIDSPMAEMDLDGTSIRWLTLQGQTSLAVLDAPKGSLNLPADTYTLQGICLQPAAASRPLLGFSGSARVTLNAGASTRLKVGAPLVSSAVLTRAGNLLELRYVLKGAADEEYSLSALDRRNPPKFAICLGDRLMANDHFKFG